MQSETVSKYAFIVVLALLGYLTYILLRPFLSYIIFSIVLVVIFHPCYLWMYRRTGKPKISSMVLVVALIALLVIPSILIGFMLIKQAPPAYESFVNSVNTEPLELFLERFTGEDVSVHSWMNDSVKQFRTFVVKNAAGFLSSATGIALGLFIMFFIMFYLFYQGDELLGQIKKIIPMHQRHQDKLIQEMHKVLHGVLEGQVIIGMLQGVLGGLLFLALGIDNALFWGFIMVILSVIPFIGSYIVWLPAAVWLILTGDVTRGIIMIIVGTVLISQVDNFLRPYIVGKRAKVHPAVVLVGVLGGLKVFGVIGFVLGPLILALFVAALDFYKADMSGH